MSKYGGKCDLWDSLVSIRELDDDSTDWDKIKIYQITEDSYFNETGWHNTELPDIKCLKDLLPYAAYMVGMAYGEKDYYVCYIGRESYVTTMEKERIEWAVKDVRRIYNKCKRKKIEFTQAVVMANVYNSSMLHTEIFKRMKAHPTSFKTDGLRVPICEYYKAELSDDMIKMGYTVEEAFEWCYNSKKIW